jgi:hypothetical protein
MWPATNFFLFISMTHLLKLSAIIPVEKYLTERPFVFGDYHFLREGSPVSEDELIAVVQACFGGATVAERVLSLYRASIGLIVEEVAQQLTEAGYVCMLLFRMHCISCTSIFFATLHISASCCITASHCT